MASTVSGYSAPRPLGASKASISRFAETVARRLDFAIGAPLEPLVAKLGGKLKYESPRERDDQGRLPESIVVRSSHDFTIFLPTMTAPSRDRFTIAHELGHLVLHYPLAARAHPGVPMRATRWVDEDDPDLARAEWEANWFAAAFLMPAEAFRRTCGEVGLAVAARRFMVGDLAGRIRAQGLGLAD